MYVRIRKRQARKLYALDVPITMVSCKMWPFNGTGLGYPVQKSDIDSHEDNWTFDALADNYTFYNSSYEEGYYSAFYVHRSFAQEHNVPFMSTE